MDAQSQDAEAREDASMTMDATSNEDSGMSVDSGSSSDAGLSCGSIGNSCSSDADCAGLSCKLPQGVCMPLVVATCGGFAGQQCPSTIPQCHYYIGADYGPCFTLFEESCVCSSAARSVVAGCP